MAKLRGPKPLLSLEEYRRWTLCTEPTNKTAVHRAIDILVDNARKQSGGPTTGYQVVFCASPQTALYIIRLVSDMQETIIPHKPPKIEGGTRGEWKVQRGSVTDDLVGLRTTAPLLLAGGWQAPISRMITTSLVMNPKMDIWESRDNFLDTALQNVEPGLDKISIPSHSVGRPLQLQQMFYGHLEAYNAVRHDNFRYFLLASCGFIWIYENFVFVSDRPREIHLNAADRLHNLRGPAIAYRDGWKIYCVNGVRVPEFVIEQPRKIRLSHINQEFNVEVRRVMIDRYHSRQDSHLIGVGAYVRDSHARRVDHNEVKGTLWHLPQSNDEPIMLLEVVNRTPEEDGSFKHYHLRVPPNIQTAAQASAWSFGLREDEYNPIKET